MLKAGLVALMMAALTAALAQTAPVDPKDPAAVGRAYLEACGRWDAEAAAKLVTRPEAITRAVRENGDGGTEQIIKEMLCLPLLSHVQYVPGEAAAQGDVYRLPATVTYTLPQTLVLRKQPDGTWKVDLRETLLSTTGATETYLVRTSEQEEVGDCLSNLKQLGLAVLQYAQDHDETLPSADKWQDELLPYLKNEQAFRCPVAPELECGYAFNAALSGLPLAQIENPAEMIVIFESAQGVRNASGRPEALAKRHNEGGNVAYVDGHVKWLKVE